VGAKKKFVVGVQLMPPAFVAPKLDEQSFELTIRQESSAFGLVQNLERELQENKQQFIAFIRRFAGEDGPELHWHLTADSPEVAEVVQEVAVFEKAAVNQPGSKEQ
jgi:diadenosine tetraphosphate (Ap4A) HIT family hydrolase